MKKEIICHSPAKTREVGEKFARRILKEKKRKRAKIISLEGELGGGKTTFLKGFARGLGIKEIIKSPTFVIMKKYRLPTINYQPTTNNKQLKTENRKPKIVSRELKAYFYHIDCYRVENPKEILALGWKEIIENSEDIVAVEWGDRIRKILSQNYIQIKFEFIDKKTRKITIVNIR